MQALRDATRDIHDDFETGLRIAAPDAGRDEYLAFISAMYGWLQPFEARLWEAGWPGHLAPEARSRKAAWLEADLRAAGLDDAAIAQLPRAPVAVHLGSAAQRIGTAYVLEGAQLGSQMLSRTLKPRLDPWPARWLSGYGEQASAYWLAFRKEAELQLAHETQRAEAAAAARAAFAALAGWFRVRGAA
nr:biliverdin-producing heme oxygenase [uncultured Noviherbaspirillum sp.]